MSDIRELTDGCYHYQTLEGVPWDIQKYWHQRRSIFSRYDEGIYMTDDGWFGVTPEPIALQVADDIAKLASPKATTIVDMFAGSGGNCIAFANSDRWEKVIAIEKDPATLACAQANAKIYGVYDKITWVLADSFNYIRSNEIDGKTTFIFASPPWGGPGYRGDEIFDLTGMQPYSLHDLVSVGSDLDHSLDMALYLPRTSDLRQIARVVPDGRKIEVVQYCMEGAGKAMVAYLPMYQWYADGRAES